MTTIIKPKNNKTSNRINLTSEITKTYISKFVILEDNNLDIISKNNKDINIISKNNINLYLCTHFKDSEINIEVNTHISEIKLLNDVTLKINFYHKNLKIATTELSHNSYLKFCNIKNLILGLSEYLTFYPTTISKKISIPDLNLYKLNNLYIINDTLYYHNSIYKLELLNLEVYNFNYIVLSDKFRIVVLNYKLEIIKEFSYMYTEMQINNTHLVLKDSEDLIIYDLKDFSFQKIPAKIDFKLQDKLWILDQAEILKYDLITLNFEKITISKKYKKIYAAKNKYLLANTNLENKSLEYKSQNLGLYNEIVHNYDLTTLCILEKLNIRVFRYNSKKDIYILRETLTFQSKIYNLELSENGDTLMVQSGDNLYVCH